MVPLVDLRAADLTRSQRALLGAAAFAATAVTFITRRPDAVTHPQFWAEDGKIYYGDAYMLGLAAIAAPVAGYLNVFDRVVAAAAVQLPLAVGPTLFVATALLVQSAPSALLFSHRFDGAVPTVAFRILLVFVYATLPNSDDIDANLDNAQWHLALVLLMLLVASAPPVTVPGRVADLTTVVIAALTGPFVFAAVLVAAARWVVDRCRWTLVQLGALAAAAGVQAAVLLGPGAAQRKYPPVGFQPAIQLHVLTGQVMAAAVVGMHGYAALFRSGWWLQWPAQVVVGAFGIVVAGYAAWRAPVALRLLLLYAGLLFVAMFAGRQIGPDPASVYEQPTLGNRYYFLPMLALLISLLWIIASHRRVLAVAAAPLLAAWLLVGIPGDWAYPAYADLDFARHAAAFDAAPSGERVEIPINPPGWKLVLRKH